MFSKYRLFLLGYCLLMLCWLFFQIMIFQLLNFLHFQFNYLIFKCLFILNQYYSLQRSNLLQYYFTLTYLTFSFSLIFEFYLLHFAKSLTNFNHLNYCFHNTYYFLFSFFMKTVDWKIFLFSNSFWKGYL